MNITEFRCTECGSLGSCSTYKDDQTIECKECDRILFRQT